MNVSQRRGSRGVSLIEVMIAVVILSFGLLALAALQSSLFRAGAETKARANATAMAQQVVENSRAFSYVMAPNAAYTGPTYMGLATAKLDSQTVGGVLYGVCRQVRRYRYDETAGRFVALNTVDADSCSDTTSAGGVSFDPATPEFKEIKVSVSWGDDRGETRVVELTDAVSAVAPADSARVVKTPQDVPRGPEVWIEPPNKGNPAVVPIAVGDDKSAASSNPVPRRFTKVDSNTAATLFSVFTFTGNSAGSEVLLNRKLDVGAVTCRCSTGAGSTYQSSAQNPAFQPVVWNGKQLSYMEPQPLPAGTKIGLFEDKGSSAKDIEAMCDSCCRDHHESSKRTQRPDPHRDLGSSGFNGSEHYLYNALATPVSSGTYSEACQLARVGGRMRITVDPKQNFMLSVPLDKDELGYEPANFAARYSGLVVDYLKDSMATLPAGYLSPTASFPAFEEATYAPSCEGNPDCNARYADILKPAPFLLAKTGEFATRQVVSFGLYVDYVNPDTKQAYECALTKSAAKSCDGLRSRNPLETLPFYAINVANLGTWSTDGAGSEWLSVTSPTYATNTGILDGNGGLVSRDAQKNATACKRAILSMTRSSSGLAGRLPIDPDDNGAANKASDALTFKYDTSATCN